MSDTCSLSQQNLQEICARLIGTYSVDNWWPAASRFEILAGAILVQNTRWTNVEKAIAQLRDHRVLDPVSLSQLNPVDLQILIRSAGCQSVKAKRLNALAGWIVENGGIQTLDLLATPELRPALLKVHGIGEETADTILCFGFSRRIFIADRYARNWLSRMGLVPESVAKRYAASRDLVEPVLASSPICMQDLHAAIVMHSQSVCCRKQPRCHRCVVAGMCAYQSSAARYRG